MAGCRDPWFDHSRFVFGVVRQNRRMGCRDPWFDHSRRGRAYPRTQVQATSSHPSRSQYPGSWFSPRRAASVAPRRLVRLPGHRAHASAEGQWHRPWPGSLQWPRPWRRRERHPRQRRVVHQRRGEHVFRMRVPCLPDQLGERSWRLDNDDKRGAWLDLREEAADNGYVLARPPQCVP